MDREGGVVMDVQLGREYADREVEKAKKMVKSYQDRAERYQGQAGECAAEGDFARAAHYLKLATGAGNDMHYWLGHMNAFQGIAAQLGFMEIVEEELEREGSCP